MTEERLNGIETMLAHHERQIQDLSAVMAAQWQEIERLRRLLDQARDTIEELQDAPGADVKPPHY